MTPIHYYLYYRQLVTASPHSKQSKMLQLLWDKKTESDSCSHDYKNQSKKWYVQDTGIFLSQILPSFLVSQGAIISQTGPSVINKNVLFLDLKFLLEVVSPRNKAESAFRLCFNGQEALFDIEKFVKRLYVLLNAKGIILTEFNLFGSALQHILLRKEKSAGGDIDFLGYVEGRKGKAISILELLDVFSQVIEETLLNQISEFNKKPLGNFEERIKKLKSKPYILKALYWNENFLFATIPLHLKDPSHPSKLVAVDIDMRINLKREASCVSSVSCFQYNLLNLFLGKPSNTIPVTGAQGYENCLEEAFNLLQMGLFFVNGACAIETKNGLRAYANLLVKGMFPIDYHSAQVYFIKWKKECREGGESGQLGVNNFFNDLEKFISRHYSRNGFVDTFAINIYLINLRTLFTSQDWSEPWIYTKDQFLKIFDEKAYFLLHSLMAKAIPDQLNFLKLIMFWQAASQQHKMSLIPHSPNIFALKGNFKAHGLLTEIPWKETLDCNWEELEHKMKTMQGYLETWELPSNTHALKRTISAALDNPNHPHISASASKSSLSVEVLHMQKTLRLVFQTNFDYPLFFSVFFKAAQQNSPSATATLRNLIGLIRLHCAENPFNALLNTVDHLKDDDDVIYSLITAIAIDLKDSDSGQDELCKALLRSYCESYRNKVLPLIFPYLNPKRCEYYFQLLWREQDRRQAKISDSTFYQLVNMALTSPESLKAMDKLFKQKLAFLLEETQVNSLPSSLLNTIGTYFENHQKMHRIIKFKGLQQLLRLGYEKEKIKAFLTPYLQCHYQEAFQFFTELLDPKLFTPQALWELFTTTSFQLKESCFFNTFSLQCLKSSGTYIPALEKYWIKAMGENTLSSELLQKIEQLPYTTNDFKRQIEIAQKPASELYQSKLASLFNKHKFSESPDSLETFWKQIESLFDFHRNTFTENDWEKLFNLIEPSVKTALPQEFIPFLIELIKVAPSSVFKCFLICFEKPMLEKISTSSLFEIWDQLYLFTQHYLLRFPIDVQNERDDKLIEAILLKISLHLPEKEVIQMLMTIVQSNSLIPQLLNKYILAFDKTIKANPNNFYDMKETVILFEQLIRQIYKLNEKCKLPSVLMFEWGKGLHHHFTKLNVSLSSSSLDLFIKLFPIIDENNYAKVYINNLKKIANESQIIMNTVSDESQLKIESKELALNWMIIWNKILYFNLSLHECNELYTLFINVRGYSLFNKTEKILTFFELQRGICQSALSIKESPVVNILEEDKKMPKNDDFQYASYFHKNFMKFYQWLDKNNAVIPPKNFILHMQMLMKAKGLKTEPHLMVFEQHKFDLFILISKSKTVFKLSEVIDVVHGLGAISNLSTRSQLLEAVVAFAYAILKLSPAEQENIIINYVLGACVQLIRANQIDAAIEYFKSMLPHHSALGSPMAISTIDVFLKKLFEGQHLEQSNHINEMFAFIKLIIIVYENYLILKPSKIKNQSFFWEMPNMDQFLDIRQGINNFIQFINGSQNSAVKKEGMELIICLQALQTKHKNKK